MKGDIMPVLTPFSSNNIDNIAESIQTLDALPVLKAATDPNIRELKELTAKLGSVNLSALVNAMVQMETLASIAAVDQSQVTAAKDNLSVRINQVLANIINVDDAGNTPTN